MSQSAPTREMNRSQNEWDRSRPHTSLVIACCGVASRLPRFLSSLEKQTADHSGYEIIFVNESFSEGYEKVIREWMNTSSYAVCLISNPTGGMASARNMGLERARGEWVSYPDPDDQLEAGYLEAAEAARKSFPQETMFAARAILTSPSGEETRHTLDARYLDTDTSLIDLSKQPRLIHTLGEVVFFRRNLIVQNKLRFQERVLHSSDTDFVARFLLHNKARYVIIPSARYFYTHHGDPYSIHPKRSENLAHYATLFADSHQKLLDHTEGKCPAWLANFLLYAVFILFHQNRRPNSPVDLVADKELARIRELLIENLQRIGADNIRRFDLFAVPLEFRMAWLSAVEVLTSSPVEHLSWHPGTGTRKVGFYTSSPRKLSGLGVPDRRRDAVEWKPRNVEFLGDTWLYQHIGKMRTIPEVPDRLRGSGDNFTFEFDGLILHPNEIRERSGLEPALDLMGEQQAIVRETGQAEPDGVRTFFTTTTKLRLPRRPGWVFLAEDHCETLQGELLYRHVARSHPGFRVSFVAHRDSSHFRRLRRSRFQVLEFGSQAHLAAIQRARYVVTPHAGARTLNPLPEQDLTHHWRTVLLPEHAIDRLGHRYSSIEQADTIAVASTLEFDRLGGKFSKTYLLPSDIALTGLPRHDLLQKMRAKPSDIVLAPHLPPDSPSTSMVSREAQAAEVLAYWSRLVSSSKFANFLERTGRKAKLVIPSKNLASAITVPGTIDVVSDQRAALKTIASAAVLLTDYSLYAQDAAYLYRPTVYLQEAPMEVLGPPGCPRAKASAFKAEGFGPVVETSEAALDAVEELLNGAPAQYQQRMEEAFHFRDGNACARIVRSLIR